MAVAASARMVEALVRVEKREERVRRLTGIQDGHQVSLARAVLARDALTCKTGTAHRRYTVDMTDLEKAMEGICNDLQEATRQLDAARAAVQPFRDWLTAEYRAADVVSALQPGLLTMRADDKRADATDEKAGHPRPLASSARIHGFKLTLIQQAKALADAGGDGADSGSTAHDALPVQSGSAAVRLTTRQVRDAKKIAKAKKRVDGRIALQAAIRLAPAVAFASGPGLAASVPAAASATESGLSGQAVDDFAMSFGAGSGGDAGGNTSRKRKRDNSLPSQRMTAEAIANALAAAGLLTAFTFDQSN